MLSERNEKGDSEHARTVPKPGHLHGQYCLTMGSLQREGSEGEERHKERKKRRDGESRQR